jgi:hypothetical protein
MKVALPIPDWVEISRSRPRPRRRDRPIPATSILNVNYERKEEDSWGGELGSHLEEALAARDRAAARCLPPPSLLRSLESETCRVAAG